ncbi:MAG: tetratricopeptide repeat protein [Rhizomicrobium sp.]
MTDDYHRDLRNRAREGGAREGGEEKECLAPPVEAPLRAFDVGLEARLQMIERAVAQLEERQDRSERDLRRRLASLEKTAFPQPAAGNLEQKTAPLPDMRAPIADVRTTAGMVRTPRRKATRIPRWVAASAVGAAGAVVMTTLALATVAGASVPMAAAMGAVSHRHLARAPLAREIALADSGDARGEARLAFSYLRGPDRAAAERWAMAAAEQGEPMAQDLVGAFYQTGTGTARDPSRAQSWFESAALRGNLKAMHNLAIAYAQARGVACDPRRAAAWFNRAAEQGYTDSQFDLAVLYERGLGVKQEAPTALKWYLIAAGSGDRQADRRAGELAKTMSIEDVAEAESEAVRFVPEVADLAANRL